MMHHRSQVVVLGGGPAGYAAAIRCGQLGLSTTLIEKESLGGTCLNVGCIPSKALIHSSQTFKKTRSDLDELGISTGPVSIDWSKTIDWKDKLVKKIVGGVGSLLKYNGVQVLKGVGRVITPNTIAVDEDLIECEHLILATGSQVIELPAFPFDGEYILNSTDLLELRTIPKSMLVLGGGIIGMEMGTVYAALGCQVTVLEAADRIVPNYEQKASRIVHKNFEKIGGRILVGAMATAFRQTDTGIALEYTFKGETKTMEAEKLAVTVGRKPNLDALSALNLEMQSGRIVVDDRFQTSVPGVYAIGDIIDGPMLAHKASAEAVLVAEGLAGEKIARSDITVIPDVVYTKPEIASAGLSEEQAEEQGMKVKTGEFPFSALGRAATTNEQEGYIKYVIEAESETVIGATIVANNASDLIAEAALAIEMRSSIHDIAYTVHPHPSFSEAHMEAAASTVGSAIHIFNRP